MDKKTLIIILVLAVVALGAWWFLLKDTDEVRVNEDSRMLKGLITGVNPDIKTFGFVITKQIEREGNTLYEDTHYTVKWTDDTQFFFYADGAQVDSKTPLNTTFEELQKDVSADIETREGSGETRTAENVWIYAGAGAPQLVE